MEDELKLSYLVACNLYANMVEVGILGFLMAKYMQYYVDIAAAVRESAFTQKKLQLLCDITGAFRPGVLTALMGVSGTTFMDVLAGRKTSGTIKGDIRIGRFPKVQETFTRILERKRLTIDMELLSFDELILAISGVQKIRNNYNPATWMLEITSRSAEAQLSVDFTQVYKNCVLYQNNKEHVNSWSTPPPSSKELYFATRFSQNGWGQFKSCLWKQHLSYWRSPSYNLMRFTYMLIASLFFRILFWDQERKICMVTVEVPYLLRQAIAFVIITYPMIGQPSTQC
ncbi:unnamed protein product [Camellia sinensis]